MKSKSSYSSIGRLITLCVVALSCLHTPVAAQNVQLGKVVDATTGDAIGGASVRVLGTTRGTYTRGNGTFRLPVESGMTQLLVRSIGYRDTTCSIAPSQTITIKLLSAGVNKQAVQVTAEIEAAEVVRRAIAKATENDERMRTMISQTYSKMKVYVDGPDLGGPDQPKESITETYSKVYYQRYPERIKHVNVIKRRQTRNIAAADNLAVFDEFVNITQPEINMLGTRMVTPLGRDALDTYTYKIVSRKQLGNALVYELAFEPASRLFPGFEGTLSIVDGTYQTVAADFSPTAETAIPFVKRLRYEQRYEKANDSVWTPMYQQVSGNASISLLAGIPDIVFKMSIEAYVTDVAVNAVIPDSLLRPRADTSLNMNVSSSGGVRVGVSRPGVNITVAKDADTTSPEFWKAHAYTEPSEEEAEAYRVADSIVQNRTPGSTTASPSVGLITIGNVGIDITPQLARTSITGFIGGADLAISYKPITLNVRGMWGEQGTYGVGAGIKVDAVRSESTRASLFAKTYSTYATIQPARPILGTPNLMNLADLLYMEYHDYFRKEGWNAGITIVTNTINASLTASWERHVQDRILVETDRPAVGADEGDYQTLTLESAFNQPSLGELLLGSTSWIRGAVGAVVGRETHRDAFFATLNMSLGLRIPTFSTGYNPMALTVDMFAGSVLTDDAPRQYQHSMLRRFPVAGSIADLATAPISGYGGKDVYVVHAEHNFSDLWWRAIGIPTMPNGRGLDLIAVVGAGSAGRSSPASPTTWQPTADIYTEAGFALSRIPTFVSDLLYLRFDAMWPVGAQSMRGTFGWSVTLSSPLQ